MAERWRLRMYGSPLTDFAERDRVIVHAASIVSNMEFGHTPCGISRGAGGIFEAPRDCLVTCVRCIAAMMAKGDTWT